MTDESRPTPPDPCRNCDLLLSQYDEVVYQNHRLAAENASLRKLISDRAEADLRHAEMLTGLADLKRVTG